jgi:hypothetical protein
VHVLLANDKTEIDRAKNPPGGGGLRARSDKFTNIGVVARTSPRRNVLSGVTRAVCGRLPRVAGPFAPARGLTPALV